MIDIIWAKRAINGLQKIYKHIEEDSPQNAEIIINELTDIVTALPKNHERYKIDEYKENNKGNYRAFEHKKIRVSYIIKPNVIEVVRVRHTKQKPTKY